MLGRDLRVEGVEYPRIRDAADWIFFQGQRALKDRIGHGLVYHGRGNQTKVI
jgi:hypothetical protein